MEYCKSGNYWCQNSHCCSDGRCCTYYYEMWWFWLIWVVIALLSCCCLYHQKRKKLLERFRQSRNAQLDNESETSGSRRRRRHSSRSSRGSRTSSSQEGQYAPLFDPDKFPDLPTYEEVRHMATDPPPYVALKHTVLEQTAITITSSNDTCTPSLSTTSAINSTAESPIENTAHIDTGQSAPLLTNEVVPQPVDQPNGQPPPYVLTP